MQQFAGAGRPEEFAGSGVEAMSDPPTTNVATCAVCSQLRRTAVLSSISLLFARIQRIPPSSPDGEWCADVVKNHIERRR